LLAQHLELNAEELIFLAGRIPERDEDLLKENYKAMPALFRRMRKDPDFAQRVFSLADEPAHEEMSNGQEMTQSKNQED